MINPWMAAGRAQDEYANGTAWVPAELTGWRRWTLKPEGLTGSYQQPWPGTDMTAECLARWEVEISRERYDELREQPGSGVLARIYDSGMVYGTRTVYGTHVPADANARFFEPNVGRNHTAPHHNPQDRKDDFKCGIYAAYEYSKLQTQWVTDPSTAFVGVVKASGRTICGTSGFRTARARIVALCVGLEDQHRDLVAEGRTTPRRVSPAGVRSGTVPLGDPEDRVAEVERNRRKDLAGFPAYAGVELFADLREMQAAFPPEDLSALGVGGDAA